MTPAEWMAALLASWTVLAVPVGLVGGWWFRHGRGRHHMRRAARLRARADRARMRAMRRNRVHGIQLRRTR